VAVLETGPNAREVVDVGSFRHRVAVASQSVSAELIGHEDDDVWSLSRSDTRRVRGTRLREAMQRSAEPSSAEAPSNSRRVKVLLSSFM
jgi:hypothetical protein